MWERYAAVAALVSGQLIAVQRPVFTPSQDFVPPPGKWIALAPFGGRNRYSSMTAKRWPYFPLLVESLLAQDADTQILLVGDAADAKEWEQLGLTGTDHVHNAMGLLSIPALAVWLRHCTALVSNDSFALYLGLSQFVPVIGLFGPTQKTEFLPPIPGALGLQAETFCSPCYHPTTHHQSLAFACPFGVACMREVRVGDVLDILRNIY
jgi:ADP-heptose:LPS heptosyltransferase